VLSLAATSRGPVPPRTDERADERVTALAHDESNLNEWSEARKQGEDTCLTSCRGRNVWMMARQAAAYKQCCHTYVEPREEA
jgi:hypothetical protein